MIGVFTANTEGFRKKFTLSFLIKVFTHYEFKQLKKNYPEKLGSCTFEDIPTHTLFGDIKCDGEKRLIFEAALTQQLNYYYPSRWEFEFVSRHKRIYNPELFHKVAGGTITQTYAFLQLIYFIRRWFWSVLFKWLLPFWSRLFHGGKDIKLWGNWFVNNDICTEQCAKFARANASKYSLAVIKNNLMKTNINNYSPTGILEMMFEAEVWGEVIPR